MSFQIDLPGVSTSFPQGASGPQIPREIYLDWLDRYFEGGGEIAIVEGEPGVGKSTLLAQYAVRHSQRTFSIFVRGNSRTAYDPDFLREDLANQLQWAITGRELDDGTAATDELIRTQVSQLQRTARRGDRVYFVVVDGLHEVPDRDQELVDVVLGMLPFGVPGFRYVISGVEDDLGSRLRGTMTRKALPVHDFSRSEAELYLSGISNDPNHLAEVIQLVGRNPAKLAQVRRLTDGGTGMDRLLEELLSDGSLLGLEWESIADGPSGVEDLLALIAFGGHEFDLRTLSSLSNQDESEVRTALTAVSALEIDPETEAVHFVSEGMASYARERLRGREEETRNLIIRRLHEPSADPSLRRRVLPELLGDAGRHSDLLGLLTAGHIEEVLREATSLDPLRRLCRVGFTAARELGREADLFRFSISAALIREAAQMPVWQSEVEARLELGEYEQALALAQSAPVDEQRLHLLAVVARRQIENGRTPEPEIEQQIRHAFAHTTPDFSAERAVEVAADLVYICPDLAVELVEACGGKGTGENALDWAFTALALSAREAPAEVSGTAMDSLHQRINDPLLREFSQGASALVKERPAGEFLAQLESVSSVGSRLYLLRQWVTLNKGHPDLAEVVEHAIELSVQSPGYTPNARLARALASAMATIADGETVRRIVGLLDVQLPALREVGPYLDCVSVELSIAEGLAPLELPDTVERILTVYVDVIEHRDTPARCKGLALILGAVRRLEARGISLTASGIEADLLGEMERLIADLLRNTAEQSDLARSIVEELAVHGTAEAISLIDRLNVRSRRDAARLHLIRVGCRADSAHAPWTALLDQLSRINSTDLRDAAVLALVWAVGDLQEDSIPMETRLEVLANASTVSNPLRRCAALAGAMVAAVGIDESAISAEWEEQLWSTWNSLREPAAKVDSGFGIARDLASKLPSVAGEFASAVDDLRDSFILDTVEATNAYNGILETAVRLYRGLLREDLSTDKDLTDLVRLIQFSDSPASRVSQLSDLSLRLYSEGQAESARKLVADEILPEIEEGAVGTLHRRTLISMSAPALFRYHRPTALGYFDELHYSERDRAVVGLVDYCLTKLPPSEPCEDESALAARLNYEDLLDVCDLLELIDSDATYYDVVRRLSQSVMSKEGKRRIKRAQRHALAARLRAAIDEHLPKSDHIRHDGFKLASMAAAYSLGGVQEAEWRELYERVRSIANPADRAYVLPMVIRRMPVKVRNKYPGALTEAMSIAEGLPLFVDRVGRLSALAEEANRVAPKLAREAVESASLSLRDQGSEEDEDLLPEWRRLIEAAYEVDDEVAASLASILGDEKRSPGYRTLIEELRVRRELLGQDEPSGERWLESQDNDAIAAAAWKALGARNAGRVTPAPAERVSQWLAVVAGRPLSDALPVLRLATAHRVDESIRTKRGKEITRPMFDACLEVAALSLQMLGKLKRHPIDAARLRSPSSQTGRRVPIGPSERHKAITLISEWAVGQARDYITLVDPYFCDTDLDVIKLLHEAAPDLPIRVLTGKKGLANVLPDQTPSDTYYRGWRDLSDEDPPNVEITVISVAHGPTPIHSRYLFTNGSGLNLGTSVNGLGRTTNSEIVYLGAGEAAEAEAEFDQIRVGGVRRHLGERVSRLRFEI